MRALWLQSPFDLLTWKVRTLRVFQMKKTSCMKACLNSTTQRQKQGLKDGIQQLLLLSMLCDKGAYFAPNSYRESLGLASSGNSSQSNKQNLGNNQDRGSASEESENYTEEEAEQSSAPSRSRYVFQTKLISRNLLV